MCAARTDYTPFASALERLDISTGDVLWVASDLFRLGYLAWENGERFHPNALADLLLESVGEDGTLLVPAFTWGPLRGEPFDVRASAPDTGTLSRLAWKRADFERTRHPVHSFSVAGRRREELCALENTSSFGSDSPFGFLHRTGAKMLMIDVDYQACFTFVHYVEESEGVWYRRHGSYPVRYTDRGGATETRRYSTYTRLPGVYTHVNGLGEVLEERGDAVRQEINGIPFTLIDLRRSFETIRAEIREHRARKLYCLLPRRIAIEARRAVLARWAQARSGRGDQDPSSTTSNSSRQKAHPSQTGPK